MKFIMDTETTLSELLALNLHECEEEVKNIVDKGWLLMVSNFNKTKDSTINEFNHCSCERNVNGENLTRLKHNMEHYGIRL